ncbi:hypothetical protein [Catenulispora subtropica]|uniref:YD repeat protein n=1 Tax=Catenulispora subtropica TaxID=450798 RepID=A0ABP5BQX1_9ACTN
MGSLYPQLDDTQYAYNPAGQLTAITDTQGPQGVSPVDLQCFGYDALGHLSRVWTSGSAAGTGDCGKDPAVLGNAVVGGPNPYWQTWTFDTSGNRQAQTVLALAGGPADQTTSYTYNTASD